MLAGPATLCAMSCPVCRDTDCVGHVPVDLTKVLEDDVANSQAVESKALRFPQQHTRRGVAGFRAVHEPVEVYDPETGKTVKVIKPKSPSEGR